MCVWREREREVEEREKRRRQNRWMEVIPHWTKKVRERVRETERDRE